MREKLTLFKDIAELLSYIVVVLGSLFAVYQYLDIQSSDKIKETLSYEHRFNDGAFLEAKVSVAQAWQPYASLFERLRQKSVKSQSEKEKILNRVAQVLIRKEHLGKDINIMVDFYESLSICMQSGICDKKTAYSFFLPYAKRFYRLHRSYIDKKSRYIADYARGLKKFTKER